MAYTRKICGRQKLPGKKTLHAFKLSGRQWKKVRIYRNCFLGEQRACVKMCTWMRENPFFSLGEMPISYTVEKIALWLVWGLVWCVCERKLCACGIYVYVLVDFIVRAIWHVDVCMCVYVYMYVCVFIYEQPERTRVCVERMRTFVVHGHILIFCACPIAFICVHTRELSSGTFFYSSFCLSLESIVVAIELYRLVWSGCLFIDDFGLVTCDTIPVSSVYVHLSICALFLW